MVITGSAIIYAFEMYEEAILKDVNLWYHMLMMSARHARGARMDSNFS